MTGRRHARASAARSPHHHRFQHPEASWSRSLAWRCGAVGVPTCTECAQIRRGDAEVENLRQKMADCERHRPPPSAVLAPRDAFERRGRRNVAKSAEYGGGGAADVRGSAGDSMQRRARGKRALIDREGEEDKESGGEWRWWLGEL
eukprot:scaffold576_cov260-Pinguiococcus_pyrenoidosus.AAC.26